ncbi:PaaI family thioesterase [Yoonia sp.]|uniref:PaaI family thioesterase n=1 Tax=Yoonia sp. TaxID=2212373 RepID=UPI0019F41039|nr:PaaI family thioesterase [Yoonia sp.]MBE0412951.1 PaaI family thioesterase [Yoonia sp.]
MSNAATPNLIPTKETVLSMSGLAFMQAMLRGDIARAPMGSLLDYRLDSVAPGRVVFRSTPRVEHANPMGGVHGGWYGTLLDSCMGCAIMTMVPQGSAYTTLEYKVNLTRAIPIGTEILATGVADHAGRSTGVAHGEIRGASDGRLYATGSTTCLIMQLPKA